jgi:hypothetical protein
LLSLNNAGWLDVSFVVGEVALGQDFLEVSSVFPR